MIQATFTLIFITVTLAQIYDWERYTLEGGEPGSYFCYNNGGPGTGNSLRMEPYAEDAIPDKCVWSMDKQISKPGRGIIMRPGSQQSSISTCTAGTSCSLGAAGTCATGGPRIQLGGGPVPEFSIENIPGTNTYNIIGSLNDQTYLLSHAPTGDRVGLCATANPDFANRTVWTLKKVESVCTITMNFWITSGCNNEPDLTYVYPADRPHYSYMSEVDSSKWPSDQVVFGCINGSAYYKGRWNGAAYYGNFGPMDQDTCYPWRQTQTAIKTDYWGNGYCNSDCYNWTSSDEFVNPTFPVVAPRRIALSFRFRVSIFPGEKQEVTEVLRIAAVAAAQRLLISLGQDPSRFQINPIFTFEPYSKRATGEVFESDSTVEILTDINTESLIGDLALSLQTPGALEVFERNLAEGALQATGFPVVIENLSSEEQVVEIESSTLDSEETNEEDSGDEDSEDEDTESNEDDSTATMIIASLSLIAIFAQ